ncbi:MAG: FumA C-terminus/TtdB family hydratase beta subunit [Christensenellaceae bacterium]|jgi:fumarate hydratase subunit beta|nr:FumA C-terminus/TtdB family hydratase beta subunit [Christensenellaceae bacterium]
MIQLSLPASRGELAKLRAGDAVLLSGFLYTARDAAHKRLVGLLGEGKPLPFELRGAAIYYAGPSPAPEGLPIGSCGPTTSARMDAYAPALLRQGHNVMVGKGPRGAEVVEAMKETCSVYFAATGGAGALLAMRVKAAETICFEDLGTEAIRRLTVEAFPVIVAIDAEGNSLFSA